VNYLAFGMNTQALALSIASIAFAFPASVQAKAAPAPAPAPTATVAPAVYMTPLPTPAEWTIHEQMTNTQMYQGQFPAAYSGAQSLEALPQTAKTFSATLFLGLRLWKGGAFYTTPEIDQGFGLGNSFGGPGQPYNGTFGVAGYLSGEAYKVGADKWYGRVHRYFIRQTINQGQSTQAVDDDQDQLQDIVSPQRVIVTAGKFGVVDVFDNNPYAHDPRSDFLNWSVIDMGSFDYAADAWGFTYGASAEFVREASTLRVGVFQLSEVPNTTVIEKTPFLQYMPVVEYERDTSLFGGHPGAIRFLAYGDYGFMAPLADATDYALQTGTIPDVSLFRQNRYWKLGGGINISQELATNVGWFLRFSAMNGTYEAFDFTEIDRSLSTGFSLDGTMWNRPNDAYGIAVVANGLAQPEINYLGAGGLGILIGDGGLTYGGESIVETYYTLGVTKWLSIKGDYQRIWNPGYNVVRGPVSVLGLQIHQQL
jgi:high affinity Mn2+ porin